MIESGIWKSTITLLISVHGSLSTGIFYRSGGLGDRTKQNGWITGGRLLPGNLIRIEVETARLWPGDGDDSAHGICCAVIDQVRTKRQGSSEEGLMSCSPIDIWKADGYKGTYRRVGRMHAMSFLVTHKDLGKRFRDISWFTCTW